MSRLAISLLKKLTGFQYAASSQIVRRQSQCPADDGPITMDAMPVPCGSWQEDYDANNKRYNMHLVAGILFFFGSLAGSIATGTYDLYLYPPEQAAKIDHYEVHERS